MRKQKLVRPSTHLLVAAVLTATVAPHAQAQNGDKAPLDAFMATQQGASMRPSITSQRSNSLQDFQAPNTLRSNPGQQEMFYQDQPQQAISAEQENAVDNSLAKRRYFRVQPPVPSAFETFVESATGKELKIFGRDLFVNVPTTFAPLAYGQVNQDYVIGPGDGLQIRGWGMVDIDVDATVDRSGSISIPRVGMIKVGGIKYRDLQGHIAKAVARVFNNFQLTVSVAQTRAVQVYVVGHAVRPGTYTLSAMSTLLNALFASGGPNATGSMRRIILKRAGEEVTIFDLYAMLIKGDKSADVPLRDGDVIQIAEAGPMLAITGNIKQQAIFEMSGATSVADAIAWAGGFDASAEGKSIVVEKSSNNEYQTVAKLSADSKSITELRKVPVGPGDILRLFAPGAVPVQLQPQHEFVKVSGEVKQSGVFEIRSGETLRELINRIGGLNRNGYVFATSLKRESTRRSQQQRLNEAADRFEHDIETSASDRLAHATDKDTVAAISADIERERRMAERLRQVKAEGRIVLELADANAQVDDLPDVALQDGDTIVIPRKPGTVDVVGSVFQPNSIIYRPHRTVDDYLAMAGGPTAGADKSEIYLIRADGSAKSGRTSGWFGGIGSTNVNPGDAIIVPQKIERNTWAQSFKEWTTILYQFGLGAAGLKVLKD